MGSPEWEQLERVSAILGDLDQDDREILLFCFVDGFSNAEIAQRIGISVPTARKRISRALLKLRRGFNTRPKES